MTRLHSFFLLLIAAVFHIKTSSCFSGFSAKTSRTRLQYQDDKHSEQSQQQKKKTTVPTLPVMGPFLNQPPLLIGAEMILTAPTPLQWQSLEEAFYRHQQHLAEDSGVSTAPLVAILDQTNDMNNKGAQGRYATIAAVVGVSSSNADTICTDNNSAFMESLAGASMVENAKVRLVGVGRAVLKEFMYQVPSSVAEKAMDEEGHLLITEHGERLVGDEDNEEDEGPVVNIIMAQFALVSDMLHRQAVSPTHAVTNMGRLSNQVEWLHQDRRNLVAGIKAAKSRLEKAESLKRNVRREDNHEELEDHDGLGLLFGEAVSTSNNSKTKKKKNNNKQKKSDSPADKKKVHAGSSSLTFAMKVTKEQTQEASSPLMNMENYGLGSSASSLTGLKELTQVLLEKLSPYYSPKRCTSEEHYYEVFSFVSVMAMDSYVKTHDLAWSLRCVSTEQRLQRTYDWMSAHVGELKEEAERMSRALQDCGEECTDLF